MRAQAPTLMTHFSICEVFIIVTASSERRSVYLLRGMTTSYAEEAKVERLKQITSIWHEAHSQCIVVDGEMEEVGGKMITVTVQEE